MKNHIRIISISILLFGFAFSPKIVNAQHSHGGGSHESHDMDMNNHGMHDDADAGAAKIVTVGNIQAAFEIYDRAKYDEMAASMNAKMSQGNKNSSHFIIISLMNKSTMEVIKNAKIEVEIQSPKGKVKRTAHAMEGGGMFHYAADFMMKSSGNYKISALINVNGKKVKAETVFTVK